MNFDTAVQTPALWKTKLSTAISKRERLDLITLSWDDRCELGIRLHGTHRTHYSQHGSHGDRIHKHLAFHTEVTKVAKAVNAGEFTIAEAMLNAGTPYAKASSTLSVTFIQLRKAAGI